MFQSECKDESFNYKGLPPEIRLQILGLALPLEVDGRLPPVLFVFHHDTIFYTEATKVYKKINYVVTWKTKAEFQALRLPEILEIRHLKTVIRNDLFGDYIYYDEEQLPVNLERHSILLENKLESLFIDAFNFPHAYKSIFCGLIPTHWYKLILISKALRKFVIRFRVLPNGCSRNWMELRRGTIGRLDEIFSVTSLVVIRGDEAIYTWEGDLQPRDALYQYPDAWEVAM
ncbi:hypothetical protein BJ875DRAFT_464183 [Amylocarpus encephaloides]|uniref:Uncharacterized protein n=1 Tax=Amylocarpus encephaloides TaxID=45428 RepID=A0A9P7YGZ6_9HELO|nr:hypothetical protein BJ875DRAFT_464183 [Amylocarpus encephaloides]